MEAYCEHYVDGDDENFLLDDQNSCVKKCIRCRKQINQWAEGESDNTWTISSSHNINVLNVNGDRTRGISNMDDNIDTLEDSPLLINPNDEFHCHSFLVQNEDHKAWRKLLVASVLCFLFMVTELIGGFIAGSLAIMTDAAHLFSDFIGFLISLLSIWVARKSPTKDMTFGYYRAEVLGAFLSVLTVWLLAAVFAVLAMNRLWKKEYDIDANTMMIVASLGLIVNIVMGAVLYGFCHNHSHGLSPTNNVDQSSSNINVRAAAAHVLGDLLQSFGVLIAAIIIKLFPNAKLADPICTLIFSAVVICTTAKVARDSIWLLLEGSPRHTSELALELQSISSVRHFHNLHIWTLAPGKDAVSVHLCVDKYCDRDSILKKATSVIKSKLNVISCTIQIETYNSDIVNSCKNCQSVQC
ncbi:proton-coupled zinc antiporter SLC30A2-like isoform X2 [Tenebrio molitor]|uniref:proton-coupled zinc antiporter SLC30A2-like isoform X2 n=1 Tax=Tenebrio molitor TaxID=7067 RepID=UPI0036248ACE